MENSEGKNIIQVAILGTQGVPAKYGGFESLVDNLLDHNCQDDIHYTVFCSSKDLPASIKEYKGARLKYVPLHANGAQSVVYDAVSLFRCLKGYDVVLVLGVSGCWCLPIYRLLSKSRLIVNIDGLEHKRDKWKPWVRKFLRFSEYMAIKNADVIIADNRGIQDYVTDTYGKSSVLIAYGGDQALRNPGKRFINDMLGKFNVVPGQYAISVCRIEPENNPRILLEAFAKTGKELLFIGNWTHSAYAHQLREEFKKYRNLHLLNGIYDLDVLYALRSNASVYIHGHSAGGTNPSLVEAMTLGIPVLAYDVVYNRETTENRARFFKNSEELAELLVDDASYSSGEEMADIAARRYKWAIVAEQYQNLYEK